MCALPDPRAYGHLRPDWQERYLRQMGVEPADWEKSFREAARHYLHRILRDRGEQDAAASDEQQDRCAILCQLSANFLPIFCRSKRSGI